MSKDLISITKKSKIKYLRGGFKIDRDTWKVCIDKSKNGNYVICPIHSWQSYQIYNLLPARPGYTVMQVPPEHWFYEHCEQWLKHQELLNYNKDVRAALKKLD